MEYNVGDKVRIVSEWPANAIVNKSGLMDHWRGQIMTIRSKNGYTYKMIEDKAEWQNGWYWFDDLIEGLVEELLTEIDISDFRELYRELI